MRSMKLMPTRLNLLAGRIAAAISNAVCFTLLRQRCGVVLMLLSVSVVSVVSIFHFLGCVADSFNDATILSGALLPKCKSCNHGLVNIGRNRCCRRCLTQKYAGFMRGDSAGFQLWRHFRSMFAGRKIIYFFGGVIVESRTFNPPPKLSGHYFHAVAAAGARGRCGLPYFDFRSFPTKAA
jgi:hypothetical protein